jgi:RNA recognition motif-containing protein
MAENGAEQIPQVEEPQNENAEAEQPVTENQEQSESTDQPEELEFIRDPILDTEEMKKIFVGGVALEVTDDELKEYFEEMSNGIVTDHVIIRKDTDKKSHFGFVTFETSELVDEILLKRDQLKFKDKQLDVNRAVPKNNTTEGAHERTKKLFIANLPTNCTEEKLEEYFNARHPKKYGIIESLQLIKKKDDKGNKLAENKGYGFITVSTEDFGDKMAIQHATFEFGGRKIELKKSVTTGGKSRRGGRGGGGGGGPMYNYGGGYGNWGGYDYGAYRGGDNYGDPYGGYYGYGGYGGFPQSRGGRGGRGGRFTPY